MIVNERSHYLSDHVMRPASVRVTHIERARATTTISERCLHCEP